MGVCLSRFFLSFCLFQVLKSKNNVKNKQEKEKADKEMELNEPNNA